MEFYISDTDCCGHIKKIKIKGKIQGPLANLCQFNVFLFFQMFSCTQKSSYLSLGLFTASINYLVKGIPSQCYTPELMFPITALTVVGEMCRAGLKWCHRDLKVSCSFFRLFNGSWLSSQINTAFAEPVCFYHSPREWLQSIGWYYSGRKSTLLSVTTPSPPCLAKP